MADSAVTVTSGSGTSVDTRTEGTNSQHRHAIVLGDPATNTGLCPVSSAGYASVNGQRAHIVRVTPTITVPGTAYSANDVFGGEMTISNAARSSGGTGILVGISMSFEDDITGSTIEVLIFDSNPGGTYTDNAALAVSDADTYLLLASVVLDQKTDLGDGALLQASDINIPYVCNGSADLYAVAVIRTAVPTPTATDAAQFTFHLMRD